MPAINNLILTRNYETSIYIYGTKVWLTAYGVVYICMLAMTFYGLSKPDHAKEGLDPFFATIVFAILSISLLPSWLIFCLCVNSITKHVQDIKKLKTMFTWRAALALLANFSPALLGHVSDETYYPLLGFYVVITGIAVWLYKPGIVGYQVKPVASLDTDLPS